MRTHIAKWDPPAQRTIPQPNARPSSSERKKFNIYECNYYGAMPTYPACKSPSEKFYIYECNCHEKTNIYESAITTRKNQQL